jgi:hypothetical protein
MCSYLFSPSLRSFFKRFYQLRQKRKSAHLERANVAIEMELFI